MPHRQVPRPPLLRTHLALAGLAGLAVLAGPAAAEEFTGQVVDRQSGAPIEGAVVFLQASDGTSLTTSTDADGRYGFDVAPGRYRVTFLRGRSRQTASVVVDDGRPVTLTGRLDPYVDEVIVLDANHRPAVPPTAILGTRAVATPPYSDRAVLEDAWTRAWLLLDVDETGAVTKLKFLKRPGYDLEPIAIDQGFALRFKPARDGDGRAVRTFVVWPVEWPAQSWLRAIQGITTRMPSASMMHTGKRADDTVPCRGSGPWLMDSVYKGYRDCDRPDLDKIKTEPWIVPAR